MEIIIIIIMAIIMSIIISNIKYKIKVKNDAIYYIDLEEKIKEIKNKEENKIINKEERKIEEENKKKEEFEYFSKNTKEKLLIRLAILAILIYIIFRFA